MKNNICLFLFLILIWVPTFPNEICINDLSNRQTEQEESDLIFLGKIVDFRESDTLYEFEIIDLLKGFHPWSEISVKFKDVNGKATNIYQPNGYWIIYAQRTGIKGGTAKSCGVSRSFQNKTYLNKLQPPPENFGSKKDSLAYYLEVEKLISENQKLWVDEVLELKEEEKKGMLFWIFGLIIFLGLFLWFFIRLRKKPVANII